MEVEKSMTENSEADNADHFSVGSNATACKFKLTNTKDNSESALSEVIYKRTSMFVLLRHFA